MCDIFAHNDCQRKIELHDGLRSLMKQHHYNVWKGDRQKKAGKIKIANLFYCHLENAFIN